MCRFPGNVWTPTPQYDTRGVCVSSVLRITLLGPVQIASWRVADSEITVKLGIMMVCNFGFLDLPLGYSIF